MLRPDEELGNFMFSGEDHRVANSIRQLRIVASSTNSHNPVLIKKKKKKDVVELKATPHWTSNAH